MNARLWVRDSTMCLGLLAGASLVSSAPNPKATPSGLLLGLCETECRTLWITNEGGAWSVKAEGGGILVARRTGFWWVGISKPSQERDWFRWVLWAAPAGRHFQIAPDTDEDRDSTEELRQFGGARQIELTFVGPAHVAASEGFATYGPQINYNQNLAVMSIDDLARPHGYDQLWSGLSIEKVLGAGADQLFASAGPAALQESESQEEREMYGGSFLEGASSDWSIVRGRGRWTVTGKSGHGSGVMRGHYFDYDVPVRVPSGVVGFDEEMVPWELVAEEFPDATDAFASPARDVIVVRTPGRLLVCPRLAGPAPGRPAATIAIPLNASTVMVQWAFGSGVARWTQQVTPLLRAGPQEPMPPR